MNNLITQTIDQHRRGILQLSDACLILVDTAECARDMYRNSITTIASRRYREIADRAECHLDLLLD